MRRISLAARATLMTAALLVCVACAPLPGTGTGAADDDRQGVVDAVQAADPAAEAVAVTLSQSGQSRGWSVEIDHDGEVSAETLADVLRAVRDLEPEPGHIGLYFFAPGTDDALDIAPAADELGVPWTPTGSGGSWLTGQLGAITR